MQLKGIKNTVEFDQDEKTCPNGNNNLAQAPIWQLFTLGGLLSRKGKVLGVRKQTESRKTEA
jgi:hypothetical protein